MTPSGNRTRDLPACNAVPQRTAPPRAPPLTIHSFSSIQPQRQGWQEPEPSHVTGVALAHCILGYFLGVVCHCFPPPLDVPSLAARCLYVRNDARDPSSERWNYVGEKHGR